MRPEAIKDIDTAVYQWSITIRRSRSAHDARARIDDHPLVFRAPKGASEGGFFDAHRRCALHTGAYEVRIL